jgi:hypothetical protein
MEALKIIAVCMFAAVLYGIVHDQITARVCLQYFTVLHPPIFHTESPTLLGIGWGAYATWPVGLFFGILFAIFARTGQQPQLKIADLIPMLVCLFILMALFALSCGLLGYFLGPMPTEPSYLIRMTPAVRAAISPDLEHRFVADWWAHIASYAAGFCGGMTLCVFIYRRRLKRLKGYRCVDLGEA